ncbi:MAG: hypothetical protein L6311_14965 [Cellulomonas sp.]|nr:hypothetical protein [Cellulomonas sp.]
MRRKVTERVPLHDREAEGPKGVVPGPMVRDLESLDRLPELLRRHRHAADRSPSGQLVYINMLI